MINKSAQEEYMTITHNVFNQVKDTIGFLVPEKGGILGIKNGIVCEYFFDKKATTSRNTYVPSCSFLNSVILDWASRDIAFCGIIHSHSSENIKLSYNDKVLADAILNINRRKLYKIYFPIVQSAHDNKNFEIISYVVQNNSTVPVALKVIK